MDGAKVMAVDSIGTGAGALNLRAASAAVSNARPAEEQQESATERKQEVSQGEESGSSAVQAARQAAAPSVNLLV
jgi:hypothetical protein